MFRSNLNILILLLFTLKGFCQKDPSDKKLLDSLIKNDEFLRMLNSMDKPSSYLILNLGIGNKLSSVNNNSVNSLQGNSKLIFTPSIAYVHKSGLGVSFGAYLLDNNGSTNFYQYALTPSYDYLASNHIGAGISYTRFFSKEEFDDSQSPIKNDIYGYIHLKRPWLQPGIALGYSDGEYKEINIVTVNIPGRGRRTFPDTAITKLQTFTVVGTVEHAFYLSDVLKEKGNLAFTPTLMINAGESKFEVTHRNEYSAVIQRRRRNVLRNQTETASFGLQSLGLNFQLNYAVGKFNFQPQFYLDYYLPETTEERLTELYNFNIGFTF